MTVVVVRPTRSGRVLEAWATLTRERAMSKDDEFDPFENTINTGTEITLDPTAELNAVLDDLEALVKNGDVVGALTNRGINASLALLAVHALRDYLSGEKARAADDFQTVSEEIHARLAGPSRGDA